MISSISRPTYTASPNHTTISKADAERVAEILSLKEGKSFEFFRFLNLSRLSLVFVDKKTGDQIVLSGDNVKKMLSHGSLL